MTLNVYKDEPFSKHRLVRQRETGVYNAYRVKKQNAVVSTGLVCVVRH